MSQLRFHCFDKNSLLDWLESGDVAVGLGGEIYRKHIGYGMQSGVRANDRTYGIKSRGLRGLRGLKSV